MARDSETKVLVDGIDTQHRQLMEALERFDASTAPPAERVARLLSELEAYTRDHFGFEERAMAKYGYPNRADHAAAHQVVRARVEAVRSRFAAEGPSAAVVDALRGAVGALLQDQMVSYDRALARFLRERGG